MGTTDHNKDNDNKKNQGEQLRNFARLSGIAFQMGGTIFVCAYLGKRLDDYYNNEKKWFTMGFVLFGVTASLYLVIKQLNRINEKNETK